MKCYFCKREIKTAIRTYVPARNNREKSNFRDLCEDCYREFTKDKRIIYLDNKEKKGSYHEEKEGE